MTLRHCDLDLTTGNDDGTTWANAYQSLVTALSGSSEGDTIYLQGDTLDPATTIALAGPTFPARPVMVIGVKGGTSNEGSNIVQSDLVPGLATGDATRAYNQTGANAAPVVKSLGSGVKININGALYFYGVKVQAGDTITFNAASWYVFEECQLSPGQTTNTADLETSQNNQFMQFFKSELDSAGGGSNFLIKTQTDLEFFDTAPMLAGNNPFEGFAWNGVILVYGTDLSGAQADRLAQGGNALQGTINVIGCKTKSSYTLVSSAGLTRVTARTFSAQFAVDPSSAKGGGESFLDQDWQVWNGDIDIETTAIRTGGANDGADGGFSLAMTPHVDETLESFWPLYTWWLEGWVKGDGNNKTLTIYIANSGSGDYDDDEAGIEVQYPSEDGNTTLPFLRSRVNILTTPAAITDDTASVWGSGGNNPQKIQVTIAPDYSGPVRVRVAFWKNFGASPETLYVDPKIEII